MLNLSLSGLHSRNFSETFFEDLPLSDALGKQFYFSNF